MKFFIFIGSCGQTSVMAKGDVTDSVDQQSVDHSDQFEDDDYEPAADESFDENDDDIYDPVEDEDEFTVKPIKSMKKRGRGRPPKTDGGVQKSSTKNKRGRKRKIPGDSPVKKYAETKIL